MASKWLNKNKVDEFIKERRDDELREEEKNRSYGEKWPNPEAGTTEKAKVYELRLLPDKNGNFYMKIYYHMFKSGEKWHFVLCPKTHDFEAYCPVCAITSKLYTGTAADKTLAKTFKRKEKFVVNTYIVDDPRDSDQSDEGRKHTGKVRIYEFPSKVESKIRAELTDTKNGIGPSIFDPSDEGFNLILKVKSTKPVDGRSFPSYDDTTFARKASAIADSEKEIDAIMETTFDLDEYIKSMEKPEENVIKALRDDLVFDLIAEDYNKRKKVLERNSTAKSNNEDEDSTSKEVPFDTDDKKTTSKREETTETTEEDLSDQELLDELRKLEGK